MKQIWIAVFFLSLLCTGCGDGGFSLYVDDERTNHYRTFARITDVEDTENVHLTVRKRESQIMAESEFYREKDTSVCLGAGRHRQQDWAGGVTVRYNF